MTIPPPLSAVPFFQPPNLRLSSLNVHYRVLKSPFQGVRLALLRILLACYILVLRYQTPAILMQLMILEVCPTLVLLARWELLLERAYFPAHHASSLVLVSRLALGIVRSQISQDRAVFLEDPPLEDREDVVE